MSMFDPPPIPSPQTGLQLGQQLGQNQQQFNVASQAGSMVNQANPFGALNYQQTGTGPGGVPIYTANTNLSAPQQGLLDIQNLNRALFGSGATGLLGGANYGASNPTASILGLTGGITSGILGNEVNYLQPFFNMQKNQEETQLLNQGFSPGTTPGSQGSAWMNAMMPLETSQALDVSNFLAQAEPQAFQQAAGLYQLPLNMANTMMAGAAPTMPGGQFVQTPQLAGTNLIGATQTEQDALNQQYQAQLAQQQAMMGGIFGLGAAGLGALGQYGGLSNAATILAAGSDYRFKHNIKLIARHKKGYGIYQFKYRWSPVEYIGVIAQELLHYVPAAVLRDRAGYLYVNYAMLGA